MPTQRGRSVETNLKRSIKRLGALLDSAPGLVLQSVAPLEEQLRSCKVPTDLAAPVFYELLLHCSSLQIDAASRRGSKLALSLGIQWATEVYEGVEAPEVIQAQAGYNLGNALLSVHQIDLEEFRLKPVTRASLVRAPYELAQRDNLRHIRRLFAEAGHASELEPLARSRALCNLGNTLDESGRWVEAYEAYADALREYPQNGNAAGNAAELLRRRLIRGGGLRGHYAAVYNEYAAKAKALRKYTVAIAGEETAARWDRLPILDEVGHSAHLGDVQDRYQQWIRKHRLSLSEAVEGLGSEQSRWDDAMASAVVSTANGPLIPPIFSAMNVLKAEYLVARRLVHEGELLLLEYQNLQDPEDSGTYTDTHDYSIYGQPSARLILAQRAAVDILDKVAVAANLHFETGLDPDRVIFRDYWFDKGSGSIRRKLPRSKTVSHPGAAVALAELSYDVHQDGLYSDALALRNAGTHRLVHVNVLEPGGVGSQAQNTVGIFELIEGCHETLQIIRSAYLYLIDLIAEEHEGVSEDDLGHLFVPMQI